VILLSAPLALEVANGNVTDEEAIHHKSLEIKDYFLDRHYLTAPFPNRQLDLHQFPNPDSVFTRVIFLQSRNCCDKST